jgi:hypothetical protein
MGFRPRPIARLGYRLFAAALGSALLLAIASAAQADRGRYVARSSTEPANPGLTVSPPLKDFRAVSRARVVVPAEWRRLRTSSGRLRFLTPGGRCRYHVTLMVQSRLAPPRDAADYVAEALPSPTGRHLLDSGQRGSSAFRVVRASGVEPRVRLDALWVGVLTKRTDIAPSGQVAWSEVRATALSRRGDECHSGTWRERLGPQLGDALATARTRLHFVSTR